MINKPCYLTMTFFKCIAVTDEFYKWIKLNECEYEHVLTDKLKIQAFKMVLEKRICLNTIYKIVNIFNCNTHLELMEELIRETIKKKGYKEVNNTQ